MHARSNGYGRWALAAAGALLGACLMGCASSQQARTNPLGPARAATGAIRAADAYPHPGERAFASVYTIDAGARAGERVVREHRPLDDRTWIVEERFERDGAPISEATLRIGDDGAALLVSSVDHAERVLTTFDPPLVLMPAELSANATRTQRLRVRIHPVDRPETVRDEGDASHDLTFDAAQSVRGGLGAVETRRVRAVLRIGLRAARVETTSMSWFRADGRDRLAARDASEQARAFGIPVRSVRRFIVQREDAAP